MSSSRRITATKCRAICFPEHYPLLPSRRSCPTLALGGRSDAHEARTTWSCPVSVDGCPLPQLLALRAGQSVLTGHRLTAVNGRLRNPVSDRLRRASKFLGKLCRITASVHHAIICRRNSGGYGACDLGIVNSFFSKDRVSTKTESTSDQIKGPSMRAERAQSRQVVHLDVA